MFKTAINSTPLTSDIANDFFNNINGPSYDGDVSFIATLRALVASRMKEDEQIHVYNASSSYSTDHFERYPAHRMVRGIFDTDDYESGAIIIHRFTHPEQESVLANFTLIKSDFCKVYDGWIRLENISFFFKKTFNVLCFIHPDTRRVVLFTEDLDFRKFHYLQCSILAFLPWYFNPNDGVSEDEMELINSLREKTSAKYEDCIAKVASQYDFKTAKIRKLLSGFETRYERIECNEMKRLINNCISAIEDYNNRISDVLQSKREYETRLLGLETRIASATEDSEIMEYFLANDKLYLEDVDDSSMTFIVKDYLTFFDEEIATSVIDNKHSYIYESDGESYDRYIPSEDIAMFLLAVINQKIRIKFCAAYKFILGGRVEALSHYPYSSEFRDCTPNPHLDQYRCMGNYEMAINTLVKENNYIMALEQSIASCKSLNFGDPPVMSEFIRRIYGLNNNVNMKCVELPDGSIVTPKEAIQYLKTEEAENE